MSDGERSDGVNGARSDSGVLTNLPRARPQRASARRIAARDGDGARRASGGAGSRRAAGERARTTPVEEPAPRQGFESERASPGGSLQPPGAVELVASAAEIVGELAKAGVSTGERVLKDVLSRLPL